jgi:hypothetical protein
MEPEGSFPYSKKSANGHYCEPDSVHILPPCLLMIHFNIIITPVSSELSLLFILYVTNSTVPKFWSLCTIIVTLGGVVVSVLATGPKVRGFKPGRGRCILTVIKSVARLPSEGK